MTPETLIWVVIPVLAISTLKMLPIINLDLAIRFEFWLLDVWRRFERKLEDMEKDDD